MPMRGANDIRRRTRPARTLEERVAQRQAMRLERDRLLGIQSALTQISDGPQPGHEWPFVATPGSGLEEFRRMLEAQGQAEATGVPLGEEEFLLRRAFADAQRDGVHGALPQLPGGPGVVFGDPVEEPSFSPQRLPAVPMSVPATPPPPNPGSRRGQIRAIRSALERTLESPESTAEPGPYDHYANTYSAYPRVGLPTTYEAVDMDTGGVQGPDFSVNHINTTDIPSGPLAPIRISHSSDEFIPSTPGPSGAMVTPDRVRGMFDFGTVNDLASRFRNPYGRSGSYYQEFLNPGGFGITPPGIGGGTILNVPIGGDTTGSTTIDPGPSEPAPIATTIDPGLVHSGIGGTLSGTYTPEYDDAKVAWETEGIIPEGGFRTLFGDTIEYSPMVLRKNVDEQLWNRDTPGGWNEKVVDIPRDMAGAGHTYHYFPPTSWAGRVDGTDGVGGNSPGGWQRIYAGGAKQSRDGGHNVDFGRLSQFNKSIYIGDSGGRPVNRQAPIWKMTDAFGQPLQASEYMWGPNYAENLGGYNTNPADFSFPNISEMISETDMWGNVPESGHFGGEGLGPAFDPDAYLAQNPDIGEINPYQHFLMTGMGEGREGSFLGVDPGGVPAGLGYDIGVGPITGMPTTGMERGGLVRGYQGGGLADIAPQAGMVPQQGVVPGGSAGVYDVGEMDGQTAQVLVELVRQSAQVIVEFENTFGSDALAQITGGVVMVSGDGRSDSIPGSIEGGEQVMLSDGEYVVPSMEVAALGNGSTEAGGRALDNMVRDIRTATTGSPTQGAPIVAEEFTGMI